MSMELHDLHPSLVHAPLVLLPAAAVVDLLAVTRDGRARRLALDTAGRTLWWAGVGAAALAGVAGLAASQEVKVEDPRARDAMWLHGLGNFTILLAASGLATWRASHRATTATAALGLSAVGASLYTAWLGGEMVYQQGVGVRRPGESQSAPLLSARAPVQLLGDAAKGVAWLFGRAAALATGKQPLARGAAQAQGHAHLRSDLAAGPTGLGAGAGALTPASPS